MPSFFRTLLRLGLCFYVIIHIVIRNLFLCHVLPAFSWFVSVRSVGSLSFISLVYPLIIHSVTGVIAGR